MSGIAKPMIHSTRAEGDQQPIAAERIINFVKQVDAPTVGSSKSKFSINFTMETGTAPKNIQWVYALEANLDTDLAAIIVLVSTVVP